MQFLLSFTLFIWSHGGKKFIIIQLAISIGVLVRQYLLLKLTPFPQFQLTHFDNLAQSCFSVFFHDMPVHDRMIKQFAVYFLPG